MAEVQDTSTKVRKSGRSGAGRRAGRIDMTAMVDVAFLLLTFFILTTTLAEPTALSFIEPEEGPTGPIRCSRTLQVYAGGNDIVYWAHSCEPEELFSTTFGEHGIREVLFRHIQNTEEPAIIIKATDNSKFVNFVDLLDEVKITGIHDYVITGFTDEDLQLFEKKGLK